MAEGIVVNHGIPEPRYFNITLRFVGCSGTSRGKDIVVGSVIDKLDPDLSPSQSLKFRILW